MKGGWKRGGVRGGLGGGGARTNTCKFMPGIAVLCALAASNGPKSCCKACNTGLLRCMLFLCEHQKEGPY